MIRLPERTEVVLVMAIQAVVRCRARSGPYGNADNLSSQAGIERYGEGNA